MSSLNDVPSLCFDGVIPTGLATCGEDGMPHFTWLSQVFKLDATHVAVSCQFFRQTKANIAARPRAQLLLTDPSRGVQWRLDLHFEGSVVSGPLFDRMHQRITVMASLSSHRHAFALQSAEVFKVLAVEIVPVEREAVTARARPARDELMGLARLTEALGAAEELGAVVEAGLSVLSRQLGYERMAIYVHEEAEGALYALGSRGFSASGVGARVSLGTGIVGTCAQHRIPVRVADCHRELRYERAVIEQLARVRSTEREIALPGLEGARSLLAVPLVLRGKLFGVLATESELVYAFDERDELTLITGQLFAQAISAYEVDDSERDLQPPVPSSALGTGTLRLRYYEADDSVFIDDDYLIKGLPGRILYLLLRLREAEGRESFQNRELRLHPFLKLPAYKDNLEARLLMLQRRLEEKGLPLTLDRGERGKIRVSCTMTVSLENVPSAEARA